MAELFVESPTFGITNKFGYEARPERTSIESINMWPFDAITGRRMSSTRPPLTPLASSTLDGEVVNMLQRVNGDASQDPQETVVAAANGDLWRWNGADWTEVATSPNITQDRAVYAVTFLKQVFILNDTSALVFDYDDDSLATATATAGTFPADVRVGCSWQGGIWVAGAVSAPHVWSGSRTGTPLDWDFGQTDTGAAFTATGENEGLIGDPITAMIPLSQNIMLIMGVNSIWAQRGHPLRGGVLSNLSTSIGCLGQGAWARDAGGNVFFLSRGGVYAIGPEARSVTPISRERIPDSIIGINQDYLDQKVSMAYDSRWNGIHIAVRGVSEQAWWYDLDDGGFHQMTFSSYPHVMTTFESVQGESASGVLYGGSGFDGVARFNTNGSETFTYRLLNGPIRISKNPSMKSQITRAQHLLSGNTAVDSNTDINIWTGGTAEDVYTRYSNNHQGTKSGSTVEQIVKNGGTVRPRLSGHSAIIEILGSSSSSRIVYEGTQLEFFPRGRTKLLSSLTDASFDPVLQFNPAQWSTSATTTTTAQSGTAYDGESEDFVLYADLSLLPADWWSAVKSNGGDIRAVDSTGRLLAMDLVEFDKPSTTGLLAMEYRNDSGAITLYCGNPNVEFPGANSAVGQYNVYGSKILVSYPYAAGTNRTRNSLSSATLSSVNGNGMDDPTSADGDAICGINATTYGPLVSDDSTGFLTTFDDRPVLGTNRKFSILSFIKPVAYDNNPDDETTDVFSIGIGGKAFGGVGGAQANTFIGFLRQASNSKQLTVFNGVETSEPPAQIMTENVNIADSGSQLATGSFISVIVNRELDLTTLHWDGSSDTGTSNTGMLDDISRIQIMMATAGTSAALTEHDGEFQKAFFELRSDTVSSNFITQRNNMITDNTTFWGGGWTLD